MNIVDISKRVITIELHPEESILIAQALEHGVYDDLFENHVQVEAMAAAFGALALAGASYSVISHARGKEVSYRNMLAGKLLDPGYLATADA